MKRIAIVDGIRTPFCKMGTSFNDLSAQDLGKIAVRELLERSALDINLIDEVIIGNVCQPADAANIARVISLMAGIPKHVPSYTVHRNCASGIEATVQAEMKIKAGEGDCYIVGGTESMSNVPFFLQKKLQELLAILPRQKTLMGKLGVLSKFKMKLLKPRIGLALGLTDPVCGLNMGQTAEVLAKEFGISRDDQDRFALESHLRAAKAKDILDEEMIAVPVPPTFKKTVESDNGVRESQTMDALAKLKPVFDRHTGTVTAGNSSQITDGAAALLMMSEEKAKACGYTPLGYIRASAFSGVDPHRMGIGPAHAIPKVLKKAGLKLSDIKSFEINEAFAAQVLACIALLESDSFAKEFSYEGYTGTIDRDQLNVHGGAIALGHPVGTTGARLILTMLKHMHRQNFDLGCVSLCIGGGQGAAVILEKD